MKGGEIDILLMQGLVRRAHVGVKKEAIGDLPSMRRVSVPHFWMAPSLVLGKTPNQQNL